MRVEPLPALTEMLAVIRTVGRADARLETSVADLNARIRLTSAADVVGWESIYREALRVIPVALRVSEAAASDSPDDDAIDRLVIALERIEEREQEEWAGRLDLQRRQLMDKGRSAAEKLTATRVPSDLPGQHDYKVPDDQLADFSKWVVNVEREWWRNNRQLVAKRAQAELRRAEQDGGWEAGATVAEPDWSIEPAAFTSDARAEAPTWWDTAKAALGPVFSAIATTLGAAGTLLGVAARSPRLAGKVESFLVATPLVPAGAVALGAALLMAAVLWSRTAFRREKAKFEKTGAREVSRRVAAELDSRWHQSAEDQLRLVRKHIGAELYRLRLQVRRDPPRRARSARRLLTADETDSIGAWRNDISARLEELVREQQERTGRGQS